jgi:hypothetical protein
VSRQSPAVRRAVTDYVRSTVDLLSRVVPGKSKAAKRKKTIIVRCRRKSWIQLGAS